MCQTKNNRNATYSFTVVYVDISVFPFSIDMLYLLLFTPFVKQT